MISRRGVWEGFVLVFWGRACPSDSWGGGPAPLILGGICRSGNAPAGCRGAGLGVSNSHVHWMALFCSLKLISADGGREGMVSPHSFPWSGVLVPTTLHEAFTEEQTITSPVSLASVRSSPSPCLCPSCPVRQHSTPVFNLRHVAGFQNSKF